MPGIDQPIIDPHLGAPSTASLAGPAVNLDVVELWVADLERTRDRLTTTLGFTTASTSAAPDRNERLAALVNGGVRVILREGSDPNNRVARHIATHGDTVADLSLQSPEPEAIARRAAAHGLHVFGPPTSPTVDMVGDGTIRHTVRAEPLRFDVAAAPPTHSMSRVDHFAYCLPRGSADTVADAYRQVMGLETMEADSFGSVGDPATGMRSIVLAGPGLTVVLTEPLSETSTGQTQQFIDAHRGAGVQHAAIAYADLLTAIEELQRNGVEFLTIPALYYDQARQRLSDRTIAWEKLQRLGVLVDADHQGLLYQLFTRPITDRGTFFLELIQRAGATGFGANNVRALFEAVQASSPHRPEPK